MNLSRHPVVVVLGDTADAVPHSRLHRVRYLLGQCRAKSVDVVEGWRWAGALPGQTIVLVTSGGGRMRIPNGSVFAGLVKDARMVYRHDTATNSLVPLSRFTVEPLPHATWRGANTCTMVRLVSPKVRKALSEAETRRKQYPNLAGRPVVVALGTPQVAENERRARRVVESARASGALTVDVVRTWEWSGVGTGTVVVLLSARAGRVLTPASTRFADLVANADAWYRHEHRTNRLIGSAELRTGANAVVTRLVTVDGSRMVNLERVIASPGEEQ